MDCIKIACSRSSNRGLFSLADIVQRIEDKKSIKNFEDHEDYHYTVIALLHAGMEPHKKNGDGKSAFELTHDKNLIWALKRGFRIKRCCSGFVPMQLSNMMHDRDKALKTTCRLA